MYNKGIPHDKSIKYFFQILDGIAEAHKFDVIHRDIKPQNILIDEDRDEIVITDFGIAQFSDDFKIEGFKTKDDERLFNINYSAPEQKKRGEQISKKVDYYASGLILNGMFTRNVPAGEDYKKIRDVNPDYDFLDEIVKDLTQSNPDKRPSDVGSIKDKILFLMNEKKLNEKNELFAEERKKNINELPEIEFIDPDWEKNKLVFRSKIDLPDLWMMAFMEVGGPYTPTHSPQKVQLTRNEAIIFYVDENNASSVVSLFKGWVKSANEIFRDKVRIEREEAYRYNEKILEQEKQNNEIKQKVLEVVRKSI